MGYDEELANRLREVFGVEDEVTEKKMFGGLAFLVDGNMAVAVTGGGGIMVRVEPDRLTKLLETTAAFPMEMRGREMRGWLRVAEEDLRTKRQLSRWVKVGTEFARTLPPK